jgi:CheY-like chemotaxis protein
MNTFFKILWFEDEVTWFNMERLRINSILQEHYLIPEIVRKDGDDFDISELTGNEYDLIIMDYKLAEGTTGDTVVTAIRENNILTDILFYSSEEHNMLTAISKGMPPIDGVYLTKRDYNLFTQKAENLINKIVKRSEDLVNLRGFVMDGSSDFEVRIQEILNIVWNKFTEEEKGILEEAVQRTIKRNEDRDQKTKKKVLEVNPTFPAAVNNIHFFSHSDRLYLLEKVIKILLDNYSLSEEEEFSSFKAYYEKEISNYRNALGHRKSTDNIIEITKGNFVPVDEALHQKMRKNLSRYNLLIEQLELFVTEKI